MCISISELVYVGVLVYLHVLLVLSVCVSILLLDAERTRLVVCIEHWARL